MPCCKALEPEGYWAGEVIAHFILNSVNHPNHETQPNKPAMDKPDLAAS